MKTAEKSQRDTFDPDERLALDPEHIAPKAKKDGWDKIGAVAPIISGMLIFVMGGWFTYTYNQQQLRLQEIQTIEKFIPHLMGNDQSKRAAILAISSLTNAELATQFAQIFSSPGTVSALRSLAESGTEKDKNMATDALARALENLAARESRLNEIESAYQQAAAVPATNRVESPETAEEALKLEKLANTFKERGHIHAAESFLHKALAIRFKISGDSKEAVSTLRKLAEVQMAAGNGSGADETMRKATHLESRLNGQTPIPPVVPQAAKPDETAKPTVNPAASPAATSAEPAAAPAENKAESAEKPAT